MRIYTVHELPGAPLDGAGLKLVKEGFSFPALAFSWAWLLWHRAWVALCLWIGLTVVISFLVQMAFGAPAAAIASFLLNFLLGAEGNDIRRWTLARKGYREIGLTGGTTLEEAERNFFAKWDRPLTVAPLQQAAAPVWPRKPAPRAAGEVMGLFPDPGTRTGL
jgi:hypothetical protein